MFVLQVEPQTCTLNTNMEPTELLEIPILQWEEKVLKKQEDRVYRLRSIIVQTGGNHFIALIVVESPAQSKRAKIDDNKKKEVRRDQKAELFMWEFDSLMKEGVKKPFPPPPDHAMWTKTQMLLYEQVVQQGNSKPVLALRN